MCKASSVGARIDVDAVPVIDGVRSLLAGGMLAGGTQRNHAFVAPDVDFGDLDETEQMLLADAQTSGGLLLAVSPDRADRLVEACRTYKTLAAAVIGHVTADNPGRIVVRTT
jgi:selenide,water dikinase